MSGITWRSSSRRSSPRCFATIATDAVPLVRTASGSGEGAGDGVGEHPSRQPRRRRVAIPRGEAQLDQGRGGLHARIAGPHRLPWQPERGEAAPGQPDHGRLVDQQRGGVDEAGPLPAGAQPAGSAWAAIGEVAELRQRHQILLAHEAQQGPVASAQHTDAVLAHDARLRAGLGAARRSRPAGRPVRLRSSSLAASRSRRARSSTASACCPLLRRTSRGRPSRQSSSKNEPPSDRMSAAADRRDKARGDTREAAGAKNLPTYKGPKQPQIGQTPAKAPCLRRGADEPINHYAAPVGAQAQAF